MPITLIEVLVVFGSAFAWGSYELYQLRPPHAPSLLMLARVRIPLVTLATAMLSSAANLGLFYLGRALGEMTIGAQDVGIFSVVGALFGALAFAIVRCFSARPLHAFRTLCAVVVGLYALGPVSAMVAPYMEGAARFNALTLAMTELMHLVSGGCIYVAFTRSERWAALRSSRSAKD